ncbi:MAG: hypothetical protein IJ449_03085 [Clostridia bacterium]|nr:hypothetical protein [Clostridia bacterium]
MNHTTRNHIRRASVLLALLACVPAVIACGDAGDGKTVETKTADNTAAVTDAAETEELTGRAAVKDNLPDDLDLGGETIRILTRADDRDTRIEFIAEEETGDIIEDAVYNRNLAVMERLNVQMEVIEAGTGATRHEGAVVNGLIDKSVLAGEDAYDLVGNHMSQITPYILKGAFLDMHDLPYLDWEQPWWNQSYNAHITLDGKQYMCAGELAQTMISGTYVTFFNKKLWAENWGDDNLYEIVQNGEWTLDKMKMYCDVMYSDLNGNGQVDEDDRFGFVYMESQIQGDAFAGGANVTFTTYDESDGYYYWTLENEHTATFLSKMKSLMHENNNVWYTTETERKFSVDFMYKMLDDTVLFMPHMLSGTDQLREMKSDYGIVPMPKLDENQEDYTTFVHNGFTVFAIPTTCQKAETVAPFLEAMCAESYRSVTPAYYDVALKVKYARDEEAAAMLDIATQSIVFDFGYLYNQYISANTALFRSMLNTTSNIDKGMSTIASKEKATNKLLAKIVDTYGELE